LHRLEENIDSMAVELTSGELKKIDEAAAQIEIKGARYPESSQIMINR